VTYAVGNHTGVGSSGRPRDWPALRAAGVVEIFGPGTVIPQAALRLLDLLDAG
jgi:methylmalonyl-CoA mutase